MSGVLYQSLKHQFFISMLMDDKKSNALCSRELQIQTIEKEFDFTLCVMLDKLCSQLKCISFFLFQTCQQGCLHHPFPFYVTNIATL